MLDVDLVRGIVPVNEAKANLSRLIREAQAECRPIVITQNGRPAAVLVSAALYDEMRSEAERDWRAAVEEGVAEDDAGEVVPAEAVRAWVASVGTDNELPPPL